MVSFICLFVFLFVPPRSKKWKRENDGALDVASQCDHQGAATQRVSSISVFCVVFGQVRLRHICSESKVSVENQNREGVTLLTLCDN